MKQNLVAFHFPIRQLLMYKVGDDITKDRIISMEKEDLRQLKKDISREKIGENIPLVDLVMEDVKQDYSFVEDLVRFYDLQKTFNYTGMNTLSVSMIREHYTKFEDNHDVASLIFKTDSFFRLSERGFSSLSGILMTFNFDRVLIEERCDFVKDLYSLVSDGGYRVMNHQFVYKDRVEFYDSDIARIISPGTIFRKF